MAKLSIKISKVNNAKQVARYILLFISGCIACQNNTVGTFVSLMQLLYIILLLCQGNTSLAVIANNIFLGASIESSMFIYNERRALYCYAYMPYVHRWGCLICEIAILFIIILKRRGKITFLSNREWNSRFVRQLISLFIIGMVTSLVCYLFNDNNIANLDWYLKSYVSEVCYWSILVIDFLIIYLELHGNEGFYAKFKKSLISFFVALVFSSWISVLLGWHGRYSYHETILMMPLVSFFAATLIIFPAYNYKEYSSKLIFYVALLGIVCMCIRTTPLLGKWLLVIMATGFSYLWLNVDKGRILKVLSLVAIALIFIMCAGNYLLRTNELLNYKLNQVITSMGFADGGSWLQNMSNSPKYRIEEFYNVFLEYVQKPWFALFGKGIGGSITHHTDWINWSRDAGAFMLNQRQSGVYVELHESFNILFLKFGICGLYFFITNIKEAVKNLTKSPWLLMGVIWFVFFINAYVSLYIVGAAFMLGMYESDKVNVMRCDCEVEPKGQ